MEGKAEILSAIRREWNKAEADVKLAEQVCHNIVIPAIKELRYAGRRLVDLLDEMSSGGDKSKMDDYLSDALFNCYRARHDAIDAATAKIAIDIDIMTRKLKYSAILPIFPKFPELRKLLRETRAKIVSSRNKREDREAIYSAIEADTFPGLVKMVEELQESEPMMREMAKQERQKTVYLPVVVGLVMTIIGAIAAWYLAA